MTTQKWLSFSPVRSPRWPGKSSRRDGFQGSRVSSVSRRARALLTFTEPLFVSAEAALRVARVCAFTRVDDFAVGSLLLCHGPVVSAIA